MSEPEQMDGIPARPESQRPRKKLYQKPDFRFERVFETRALTCGKISDTQAQCLHELKNS